MFFDRTAGVPSTTRAASSTKIFAAPKDGWVRNQSLAKPKGMGAEVLDNFFPTTEGIRMRKGSIKRATCTEDAAITHLATYETSAVQKMFATDAGNIYNVTPADVADADVELTAEVEGLTGGDWSSIQYTAGGGVNLIMVNGSDDLHRFNGTQWLPVDDVAVFSLAYDAETAAFTAGQTLTGGTSTATATIKRVIDDGTTGTLWLTGITGTFQNDETITDGLGGSATANGVTASLIPAITGVSTAALSCVWSFKSRLFFIEANTLSAWYLPSLAIAGAASELDLGGVFTEGGSLLFGATYSRDAGAGLDDFCVFVTENGEIALYQGSDPSDSNAWALVGVYRVGKPLGKNAIFRAGGDIAIATNDGIVSLTQALSQDRAGQTPITYPIEEFWRYMINERAGSVFPFQTRIWHKQSMAVVSVPTFSGLPAYCLVVNTKTGAWARYTGWDTRCITIFQDKLYFGTALGTVIEGEVGGADQDASYSAVAIPRFDMFNSPAEKMAMHARLMARTNKVFSLQLFAASDYEYDPPNPLPADDENDGEVWGAALWGSFVWGESTEVKSALSEWQAVAAVGTALAPGIQISSGRATEPDIEIISLHLQYNEGQVMT